MAGSPIGSVSLSVEKFVAGISTASSSARNGAFGLSFAPKGLDQSRDSERRPLALRGTACNMYSGPSNHENA